MSRSYCQYQEEDILCIAESRGDSMCCDKCPLNNNNQKIKELEEKK